MTSDLTVLHNRLRDATAPIALCLAIVKAKLAEAQP